MVSTVGVFTVCGTARVNITDGVFVFFSADVPEIEETATAWVVGDHVFEMGNTPLIHLGGSEV